MPTVSVFIASYNHVAYLPETLQSVLGQSYQDFEIVVVDDGSTDGSHELLLDYQRRYPHKIRCFWHEGRANKGVTASSNVAMQKSRGRYLAWLGSDDVWSADKLAKQMHYVEGHPGLGMVCSYAHVVDEDGNRFPGLMGGDLSHDAFRQLVVANVVCPSTVLMSRVCLDDVGLFNEQLVNSDWELFIRIAATYPVGFLPEPLAAYRLHGHNMSLTASPETKLQRRLAVIETVFRERTCADPGLRTEAHARVQWQAVLDYCTAGRVDEARRHLEATRALLNGALPVDGDELIATVVAYALHSCRGTLDKKIRFVRDVFATVAPRRERKAIAQFHIGRAFTCRLRGDVRGVRRCLASALWHDPGWLCNRGVLSIGAEAFLPHGTSGKLRRLGRALAERSA